MRFSASQLGSFERCPTQFRFEKVEKRKGRRLSATQYGTVVHHALHAFERHIADGGTWAEALEIALATFDHYWHPSKIHEVADGPVEIWIRGDDFGGLRQRGLDTVKKYAYIWRDDKHVLLSLEHPFEVPIRGTRDELTGELHTISGYVDRLVLRQKKRVPILDTDDWKTGNRKPYLRHHIGFTVYAYATTERAFWDPFEGMGYDPDELFATYRDYPRHANWYDLKSGFKLVDAGYRGERDYARLAYACNEMARSVQNNIFPLRISGDICQWCPFAEICPDGSGLPAENEGAPAA